MTSDSQQPEVDNAMGEVPTRAPSQSPTGLRGEPEGATAGLPSIIVDAQLFAPEPTAQNAAAATFDPAQADLYAAAIRPSWQPPAPSAAAAEQPASSAPGATHVSRFSVPSAAPAHDEALSLPIRRNQKRAALWVGLGIAGFLLLAYFGIASSTHDAPAAPQPVNRHVPAFGATGGDPAAEPAASAKPNPAAAPALPAPPTLAIQPRASAPEAAQAPENPAMPAPTSVSSASSVTSASEAALDDAPAAPARRAVRRPNHRAPRTRPPRKRATAPRAPKGAGFVADSPY